MKSFEFKASHLLKRSFKGEWVKGDASFFEDDQVHRRRSGATDYLCIRNHLARSLPKIEQEWIRRIRSLKASCGIPGFDMCR